MKKYDVFISYSRKDSAFAEKVCAVLDEYKQHYKFEYFFDREEIKSKHDYLERISEAIFESRVMLFLASKNSTASEFCIKELLFADEEKVLIHQYRLDDTSYPKSIRLLLGNHHYRVAKDFSIENMVSEVLAATLQCEIKPLAELRKFNLSEENEDKKPKWNLKKIMLAVAALAVFCGGCFLGGWLIGKYILEPYLLLDDKIYEVGDYYKVNDNKGVVFYVDETGKHGKIVSLDQAVLQWCTDQQYSKNIVVGADSTIDGKKNTDIAMSRIDSIEYSAFVWCRSKGKDWYLPAEKEMESLLLDEAVYKLVNNALKYIEGGAPLVNFGKIQRYWTSTETNDECAWDVYMFDGNLYHNSKHNVCLVRAVAQF